MDTTGPLIDTIFSFSRCMREKMGVNSDVAKLSVVQLQTLVFLKKNTSPSMKKIADYLQVELPSATSLIENLVKMDLVMRTTDSEDKRSVQILLTPAGETLLHKAKKERAATIEKVLSPLSENEKKQLQEILKKMINNMERTHEK